MYVHTYVCAHTYICAHTYVCAHTYACVCVYVHMYIRIIKYSCGDVLYVQTYSTYVGTVMQDIRTYMRTYVCMSEYFTNLYHTHVRMYAHTHVRTYVSVCTYILYVFVCEVHVWCTYVCTHYRAYTLCFGETFHIPTITICSP